MTAAPTREQLRRMRQRRVRRLQQEQEPMAESKWLLPAGYMIGWHLVSGTPMSPEDMNALHRQGVAEGELERRPVARCGNFWAGAIDARDFPGW